MVRDMAWYDGKLKEDSYLIGAGVYDCGGGRADINYLQQRQLGLALTMVTG